MFLEVVYGATDHTAPVVSLVEKIKDAIFFPLISLLLAAAVLVFLWGVFQFVKDAESEEARRVGKRTMLFGIIGIVVMTSALAILEIAATTFGVDVPN